MTKIFYDTEFIERGPLIPLRLVSIGMVREDTNEEFYAINGECLSDVARHPWLSVNVLPYLPARGHISGGILEWDKDHADYQRVLSLDTLTDYTRAFIQDVPDPELWAYYGAYDHVVLCQLFGTMAELPAGLPMWTHDLMQEHEYLGRPAFLPPPLEEHNALVDARWVHDNYQAWHTADETVGLHRTDA